MMPEMTTAPASVKANSRKSEPVRPWRKADRRINGRERNGHGDDGDEDLLHADDGRIDWFQTLLDVPVNVLQHHDGVVDHETDGQHHRQQGQQVDRIAEREEDEADAHEGERDRHDGDQHRAERAQEQQDHHDDDERRFADGLEHLLDGRGDEVRCVVDDLDVMPFGRVGRIASMAFVTSAATVSGLAAGVGVMPMKVPSLPLKLTLVSVLFGPSSTSATSRRRTS